MLVQEVRRSYPPPLNDSHVIRHNFICVDVELPLIDPRAGWVDGVHACKGVGELLCDREWWIERERGKGCQQPIEGEKRKEIRCESPLSATRGPNFQDSMQIGGGKT
jgi:hypothetical protein